MGHRSFAWFCAGGLMWFFALREPVGTQDAGDDGFEEEEQAEQVASPLFQETSGAVYSGMGRWQEEKRKCDKQAVVYADVESAVDQAWWSGHRILGVALLVGLAISVVIGSMADLRI